jgi:hypothetical protein
MSLRPNTGSYSVSNGVTLTPHIPLGTNYTSPVLIGYVLPPTATAAQSCSVPLSGALPTGSTTCTNLSKIPVYQFEKTTTTGVEYAYTTDYCILAGPNCPANSEGVNFIKPSSGYSYDGIVFYVAGNLPLMNPQVAVVSGTPETVPPIVYVGTSIESGGQPLEFGNGSQAIVASSNSLTLTVSNSSYGSTSLSPMPLYTTDGTYAPALPYNNYTPNCTNARAPLGCKVDIGFSGITAKEEDLFDANVTSPDIPIVFRMANSGGVVSGGGTNAVVTFSPGGYSSGGVSTSYPFICTYGYHDQVLSTSGGTCAFGP